MLDRRTAPAATALLAAALLLLTGCGSAGDDAGAGKSDSKAGAQRAGGQRAGDQQQAGGHSGASSTKARSVQVARTALIRTATLTIETGDVQATAARARGTVQAAGGYVGDETTSRGAHDSERSRLTLRVPADRYDAVLDDLAHLKGRVTERREDVKDVTDQVVDVASRVKSQQASVDRIRKLMDDAGKLADVVKLEGELATRQADLESLKSRQASLKDRTDMGTISLKLSGPGAAPEKGHRTTVAAALGGGWDAFTATLRWVGIVLAATLPFLAVAALVVVAWRRLRHLLPRRSAPAGAPGAWPRTPPAPAPPGGNRTEDSPGPGTGG